MSITLPRTDIIDNRPIIGQKLKLMGRSEYSRLADGRTIVKNLGPAIWIAEWSFRDVSHDTAVDLEAIINSLDDGVWGFYGYDIRRPYPKNYPDGVFDDTFTIDSTSDNKTIKLSDGPANFALSRGDYMQFNFTNDGQTYRALHQIMEDVTADGSGDTAWFEIRPHLIDGAGAGTAVTLKKPSALFKLEPNSFDPGTVSVIRSNIGTLTAYQSFIVS